MGSLVLHKQNVIPHVQVVLADLARNCFLMLTFGKSHATSEVHNRSPHESRKFRRLAAVNYEGRNYIDGYAIYPEVTSDGV